VLYARGDIIEIACWLHARRKFKEAAELLKILGRPHEALRFIKRLYRVEREIRSRSKLEFQRD